MFEAPYPPYDPTDKAGFSYDTVVKRWPVILTGIIDQLYRKNHEISVQSHGEPESNSEEKIAEGKVIIEKISKVKYRMGRDHPLDPIPEDGEALAETYNAELERLAQNGKNTWFTAPWLYAECYLYRLLRSWFSQTQHWKTYDPFFTQKLDTFQKSGASIYQIATIMYGIENEKITIEADADKLGVLFQEMIQMCLWGNATDLSLLTHLSPGDIENLQTVGKEAHQARKEYILKDDQDAVWEHLKTLQGTQRIDFVLDNAGFELFTDFVFADFLVTYTPHVSQVVFHPKLIPWFVSDVTPNDFATTVSSLLDQSFFPPPPDASAKVHLEAMVRRWKNYVTEGTFVLSVPETTPIGAANVRADFWTSPWPYWDMESRANELWTWLSHSGLVIFKGDLNYRKLTGDVRWPASTPFGSALGPLAGSFPLLSLRTNKADVVVGVDQAVADELDTSGNQWRVNGRYALVSFLPVDKRTRVENHA